jgi:hypothetical protein
MSYRKQVTFDGPRGDIEAYLLELSRKLNREFKSIERSLDDRQASVQQVRQIVGSSGGGTTPTGDLRIFRHIADADGSIKFSALSETSRLRFDSTAGISLAFDSSTRKITIGAVAGEIDHDSLLNYDPDRHFLEGDIEHQNIQGAGTYNHTEIDSHINNEAIHRTLNFHESVDGSLAWYEII